MADEAETEPARDLLLQSLDLCIPELDDGTGLKVDQVIMVGFRRPLVPGMTVAEFMTLKNALRFQAPYRPVDGGERDMRALRHHAAVQFEHVGMILGVRENLGDQAALARQSHPLRAALGLDAVRLRQGSECPRAPGPCTCLPVTLDAGARSSRA
jgi:hypothetical protein